jgi:hypothetical protein
MKADSSAILNFVKTRRPRVVNLIPTNVVFRITGIGTTNLQPEWDGEFYSPKSSERVRGSVPIEAESLVVLREGEVLDTPVTWTLTGWSVNLPVDPGTTHYEVLALSSSGDVLGSVSFHLISSADWPAIDLTAIAPATGPAAGGTRVTLEGAGFQPGLRVYFGGVPATDVNVVSLARAEATTPPGAAGKQTVRVVNVDGRAHDLIGSYVYSPEPVFVRGDTGLDGELDIGDAVRTLLFLFKGTPIPCPDAADFGDDGQLAIGDAVATLNYLFRGGPAPRQPFPAAGPDTTPDALGCPGG